MELNQAIQNADAPPWKDDEGAKKSFGIELAKTNDPFEAALKLFNNHTKSALWVVANWSRDPIVEAAKESYLKEMDVSQNLLDKTQLAAKLLNVADEKHPDTNLPLLKAPDRLAAYKLYSEIMGFIGSKAESKNSANQINEIKINFVNPNNNEIIEVKSSQNSNENLESIEALPIKVKLIG